MMRLVSSFIAGGLFAAGLYLSGMTDTAKVQGWLQRMALHNGQFGTSNMGAFGWNRQNSRG